MDFIPTLAIRSVYSKVIVCWVAFASPVWIPASVAGSVEVERVEAPALRGKAVSPVLGFTVRTDGSSSESAMEGVDVTLLGPATLAAVARVHLAHGPEPVAATGAIITSAAPSDGTIRLRLTQPVPVANQTFWLAVTLADDADLDTRVTLELQAVRLGGKLIHPAAGSARSDQRIGIALRQRGDDGSDAYRIPGLTRSSSGSLIAVYDVRREHCRDLPARIDVGVSRSIDGGRTWSPMQIAMTPASLGARYASGGIGDPAVLVDRTTGRIWISALWAHDEIGWESSKPGFSPEETGQLLMTFSDDDGFTWAPLRNLTPSIKNPTWRLCFNSPGAGICLQDGTLVFPAIYRAADGGDTQGKPFATIIWSRDHGRNWRIGTGAKINTTESQVVELADGTLMLNCRDNRGATRTVMTTRDLGATWEPHATDRQALEDPVCMAGLLHWPHPRYGDLLIFSNPASIAERNNMTLKISRDQGMSWPDEWHLLYDARPGSGYSCLAAAGDEHLGVLYEGKCEIYFLRIPLADFFP